MRLFIWSDEVSKARLVRDAARPGGHRVHGTTGPRVAPTAGSATSPPLPLPRSAGHVRPLMGLVLPPSVRAGRQRRSVLPPGGRRR